MVQNSRFAKRELMDESASSDGATRPEKRNQPTLGNGFFALADQVIVSGTRFLIMVMIARACGEIELGVYALVISLVFSAIMIQQTLISTPYSNFRNRMDSESESNYFTEAWNLSLLFSASVFFVFVLIGAILLTVHVVYCNDQSKLGVLSYGIFAAAIAAPFIIASEFFRRTWLIRLQAKSAFAFDMCVTSAVIGLLIMLSVVEQINSLTAFCVLALVHGAAALIATRLLVSKIEIRFGQLSATRKRNWDFGKWIFSSEAVTFCRSNLVKWIIGRLAVLIVPWMLGWCIGGLRNRG